MNPRNIERSTYKQYWTVGRGLCDTLAIRHSEHSLQNGDDTGLPQNFIGRH